MVQHLLHTKFYEGILAKKIKEWTLSFHFYKEIWHYWGVALLWLLWKESTDPIPILEKIPYLPISTFEIFLNTLSNKYMIIIQIVRVLNVLCVYVVIVCRTWKEFESSSIGSKVDCIHILCYLLCNHFFLLFFPLSSALFYNHHVISKGGKRVWSGIFRTYFHNHFCLFSFIISQWCKKGNN